METLRVLSASWHIELTTELRTPTFKIQMGRPVPLNMRNHPLPASVKTWVILYAGPGAGGIEIVEGRW